MARSMSKRNQVKVSTSKPLGKPQPGDKPSGLSKLYSSTKQKTVIRLMKEEIQKYLSFTIKTLRQLSKTF